MAEPEPVPPVLAPLLDAIENPFAEIRLGAVQQLTKLSKGKNLELARAAREALEKIAAEDDSHRVVEASAQALEISPSGGTGYSRSSAKS